MRALGLTLGLLAMPVMAQTIGDWTVMPADGGCGVEKVEYQGAHPSTLRLLRFADGKNAIELRNAGWSVAKGDERQLYVLVDNEAYETKAVSPSDHAILFPLNAARLKALKSAKFMTVFLKIDEDSQTPLEQFKLSKSGAAIESTDRCIEALKAADRRQQKVPSDPFARTLAQ